VAKKKVKSLAKPSEYIIFVDPASISSAWALFKGKAYFSSGTVLVDRKLQIFERLSLVFEQYLELELGAEEVHIEQLVRNTHVFTHWSVAIIGCALGFSSCSGQVSADIPINAWQKASGWERSALNKLQKRKWEGAREEAREALTHSPLAEYVDRVSSLDELAAIGMGLYFVEKNL